MKLFKSLTYSALMLWVFTSCASSTSTKLHDPNVNTKGGVIIAATKPIKNKVIKTDEEWKQFLPDETYRVARKSETEYRFTSPLYTIKDKGVYKCSSCDLALFKSEHKFDSGTGWPSFYGIATDSSVVEKADHSGGMVRAEVKCARCDAHLGHVFNDGPKPTGLRFCINGVCLKFDKTK